MNTSIMKINDGGKRNLLNSALNAFNGFKEMYLKAIEATTAHVESLMRF